MPDPEEWIRDELLANGPIRELLDTRVYPGRAPQRPKEGPFPDCANYARGQTDRGQDADGYSGTSTTLSEVRFWSTDHGRAKHVAKLAAELLADRIGTFDGLRIQRTHIANEFDEQAAPEEAADKWLYARVLVVEVAFD